jgi:hypothetical protein
VCVAARLRNLERKRELFYNSDSDLSEAVILLDFHGIFISRKICIRKSNVCKVPYWTIHLAKVRKIGEIFAEGRPTIPSHKRPPKHYDMKEK